MTPGEGWVTGDRSNTFGAGRSGRGTAGLLFLSARDARPTRERILDVIDAVERTFVSVDPVKAGAGRQIHAATRHAVPVTDDECWLELLRDGLAFDLLALAPGPALDVPETLQRIACTVDPAKDALAAFGLFVGPHLSTGAATLPVLRTQLAIAADLVEQLPEVGALHWTTSGNAIDSALFVRLVREWLCGGAFPALAMVRFIAGDIGSMHSEGLGFLIGQELQFDAALSRDRIAATRIGVRLIHELVASGPVAAYTAFELGSEGRIALTPSSRGDIILASRE